PRIAVPVHGEVRHLAEHARLAQACQVPQAIVAGNGSLVRLGGGAAGIIDRVPAGRLYVEGGQVVSDANSIARERSRMAFNGAATVTIVVDLKGKLLADPQL